MCSNDQMIVIILGLARHTDFSGTVQVCPHSYRKSVSKEMRLRYNEAAVQKQWQAKSSTQSVITASHHSDGLSIFLVSAVGQQDDQNYVKRVR